jgi:hypothetical protein
MRTIGEDYIIPLYPLTAREVRPHLSLLNSLITTSGCGSDEPPQLHTKENGGKLLIRQSTSINNNLEWGRCEIY